MLDIFTGQGDFLNFLDISIFKKVNIRGPAYFTYITGKNISIFKKVNIRGPTYFTYITGKNISIFKKVNIRGPSGYLLSRKLNTDTFVFLIKKLEGACPLH